jgi:ribosomal protein S18 acetylase RimI-like enzyme
VSRFFSEALAKQDRSNFASGNEKIDLYFRTMVSQDVKRRYAACYVLIERESGQLAGFYTLSSSAIPLTEIPSDLIKKLPRYPTIPAILIGWLGRDVGCQGQNVGSLLIYDAIARVASSPAGAHAIIVDAIDDAARAFYRKHFFIPFANRPESLFIEVAMALTLIKTDY